MVHALKFLDHKEIADKLSTAPQYFKTVETELRLVQESEIGTMLVTYISKNQTIERETEKKIERGHVVARNSVALDPKKSIYNEWLIPISELVNLYNIRDLTILSHRFSKHMKTSRIRAIPITPEIIALFDEAKALETKKATHGEEEDIHILHIMPPWGTTMKAFKNDFLTSGGYSISALDMKPYEKIETQSEAQAVLGYAYQHLKSHYRSSSDSESPCGSLASSTFESSASLHHRFASTDSVSSISSTTTLSSVYSSLSPQTRDSISQSSFYSAFESPVGPVGRRTGSGDFVNFRLDDFDALDVLDDTEKVPPLEDSQKNSNDCTT